MILKPVQTRGENITNYKAALEKITKEEFPAPKYVPPQESAAIKVLREAAVLPKREIVLVDRTDGDELTPSEVARRAFEDEGLSFSHIAREVSEIMRSGDLPMRMRAIEFATKILANNASGKEDAPLPQPVVTINILAKTESGGNKTAFDLLIPTEN